MEPIHQENRECNICKKVGHIARNCNQAGASTPSRPSPIETDAMVSHKTAGAVCDFCSKPGHVKAQCWSAHPELVPKGLQKKRLSAMVTMRKRQRALNYPTKDYTFQGLAIPRDALRHSMRAALLPTPSSLTAAFTLTQTMKGMSLSRSHIPRYHRRGEASTPDSPP